MSKLLQAHAKQLDQSIHLLDKEIQRLQTERAILLKAKSMLGFSYKTTPKLENYKSKAYGVITGRAQNKALEVLKRNATVTPRALARLTRQSPKAASLTLGYLVDKGVATRAKRGVFKLK